ncbi:NIL domain-containing protein [Leptolyngbya sp. FACHB-261]|uniref:NIL domain-containing protein n=1 Tax=Leptolyngbya sp. FACHB-261 TaxID=2692806 RepID=UPI001681C681|nr:NIL domain-containing protein [Leptolyngbya sp. FACHB-261]MBD2100695.1 NIL domain-containing protein [Leptolyngbya sp. FACHB-261]
MVTRNNYEPPDPSAEDQRLTQTRIRIRIPRNHQEPVISHLVSRYGLTINISAALLGASVHEDGWFDLELRGAAKAIRSALIYLSDLDVEIWHGSNPEQDGW